MIQRIYGFDGADPRGSAERFARAGIQSVVSGNSDAAAVFAEVGLDYYLCCGCFSLPSEAAEELLCETADGGKTAWFGSGCPNEPLLQKRSEEEARRLAKEPRIKGVIIDGARFASFAGKEGIDAFFTCFCPRCMEKMERFGLNAEAIRAAVHALRTGIGYRDSLHRAAILQWLHFRERCVTEHLQRFTAILRQENPKLRLGIYCFAPSLAPLVGQNIRALSHLFDFVSPMLYRYYPESVGPACPDHEWAAILQWLNTLPCGTVEPIRNLIGEITGQDVRALPSPAVLRQEGYPMERLKWEAARSAEEAENCCSEPILSFFDPRFSESVRAMASTTQTVDCFAYRTELFAHWLEKKG